MWLLTADEDTKTVVEPSCRLDCKSLTTKDYTDLLWTTVAEFPGQSSSLLIYFLNKQENDLCSTKLW